MGELVQILKRLLLMVSALFGPVWCIFCASCAYIAWMPGIADGARLFWLTMALVVGCWVLWGVVAGPERLRGFMFLIASVVNLWYGVKVLFIPEAPPIFALPFIGYSLWQAVTFDALRRKAVQ